MRGCIATRRARRMVILGPERAYEVDAIGLAVLDLCDGRRSLAAIAGQLAQTYSAPVEIIPRGRLAGGPTSAAGRTFASFALQDRLPFALARRGPARRTDPSLPAAVPLLLEPARTGARQPRTHRRRMGRDLRAGGRDGGAAIAPVGRRADGAPRSRPHPRPRGRRRPLHQPGHRGGAADPRPSRPARRNRGSIMCRCRSQDVVPDNADRISGYSGGLAKKRDVARWTR